MGMMGREDMVERVRVDTSENVDRSFVRLGGNSGRIFSLLPSF